MTISIPLFYALTTSAFRGVRAFPAPLPGRPHGRRSTARDIGAVPHRSPSFLTRMTGDNDLFDDDFGEPEPEGDDDDPFAFFREEIFRRKLRLRENISGGNWNVRGFSLDPTPVEGDTDDGSDDGGSSAASIRVCQIASDNSDPSSDSLAIARTDGSVCIVQIGTEYLASFQTKTKLVMEGETIRSSRELIRDEGEKADEVKDGTTPFEIVCQFQASAPVTDLIMEDDTIFIASEGGIEEWDVSEGEGGRKKGRVGMMEEKRVRGVHTLKLIPGSRMMLSVSHDGVALWDRNTGNLVRWVPVEGRSDVSVICADLDTDESVIYLGLSTGYVIGYTIREIVDGDGDCEARYCCNFKAFEDEGVTALRYGGRGALISKRGNTQTGVLIAGGQCGTLKQWEMIPRKEGNDLLNIEQWPRLANQRLRNRAHAFVSKHEGKITSVTSSGDVIVTCGTDGTIFAHSSIKGHKIYTMDGFAKEVSNLVFCAGESLLVTDGMGGLVCLHDFDVEVIEEEDDDLFEF